jgi:2-dehydropantoate 2-reductase
VRIAILGPGGVGGFLAAALWRARADVAILAREETAALIAARGLEVESVRLGAFTAHPPALARLDEPVEALIVATKAIGLDAALSRVAATPALVVPVLNGRDHMDTVRERFGAERVAAGVIRVESDQPEPGRIVQSSPFLRVDLAADQPLLREPLARLGTALEGAGIPVRMGESEAQVLWSKLVRLAALALTTSAFDCPLGEIRRDPARRSALERAVAEGAAVAAADGASIDPRATLAELEEAHPGLGSSMRRDIAAGRTPELDAIAGSVLRAAARYAVPCPVIAELTEQVARRGGIAVPAR